MRHVKEFDLIVFGAAGFIGRQAAFYIAETFPPGTRWAIASRTKDKVINLFEQILGKECPPREFFCLDHKNKEEVSLLVQRTYISLNFAGPFSRYAENIVAACAEVGTHYFDISGEMRWIKKMIAEYEGVANKSGAIIVPCSGFEALPADLGVWYVLNKAKHFSNNQHITKVVGLFDTHSEFNGTSFITYLDVLEDNAKEHNVLHDVLLLVPQSVKRSFKYFESRWPIYFKPKRVFAVPFFMMNDAAVIYRSQGLRLMQDEEFIPFEYIELLGFTNKLMLSWLESWIIALLGVCVEYIGSTAIGRNFLRFIGPKLGTGPSEKKRNAGYFNAKFLAFNNDNVVAESEIIFQADPSNKATIVMICESARCFLLDYEDLPKISGGFWTPSTVFGRALIARLTDAGCKFK